eukprot:COSAG06_NODE_508_length_14925_cov_18.648995_16_plen_58_part_00
MLLPEAMEEVQARALVSCGVRLSPPAAAAQPPLATQLALTHATLAVILYRYSYKVGS